MSASGNRIKKMRHMRVLELIETRDVVTQEDLMNLLKASGFDVTQATVSRDIRELQLTKTQCENGVYKYKCNSRNTEFSENKYTTMLYEAIISCHSAGNLLVVKTFSGMAPAAAAAIDHLGWDDVIGSIAGDDTVFIAAENEQNAQDIKYRLSMILSSR